MDPHQPTQFPFTGTSESVGVPGGDLQNGFVYRGLLTRPPIRNTDLWIVLNAQGAPVELRAFNETTKEFETISKVV